MINLNATEEDLYKKLKIMAFERSKAFCYLCYIPCPKGRCPKCYSDDLMRELDGVGVEYGPDWIIEHILADELEAIDEKKFFEESLEGCYPEITEIGFLKYDTISAMKELDPICFEMAQNEHLDFERSDGRIVSFDNGSTHYLTEDVEELVCEIEIREENTA